jgi:putative transposase
MKVMPRNPRVDAAGAFHHVCARGVVRQPIFRDDADRRRYLLGLGRVVKWMSWRCLSYCLMGNHIHLVVETRRPTLSRGVQRLHGEYARTFNKRHERSGHLFEGRFRGGPIESDAHLWMTIRYIAHNPVEAGLCGAPEDWPWSSHAAIAAGISHPWLDTERLFSLLETYGGDPRQRYTSLVKGSDPLTT